MQCHDIKILTRYSEARAGDVKGLMAPWETSNWSGATLAELGPLMMRYLDAANKFEYRDLPGTQRMVCRDLLPLPLP